MAAENKTNGGGKSNNTFRGKKRKQFLPHNKLVKKKGAYALGPGVQGFFITCDGGRERQAAHEALFVIDSVCFLIFFSPGYSSFFGLIFLMACSVLKHCNTAPVKLLHKICDIYLPDNGIHIS